jgi:quinol monooxygenase YgiN
MATIVNAIWTAIEGHEGTVAEELTKLVEASQAEDGVLVYEAYVDDAEPRVFRIFEKYVDDEAFQAHLDSAHFTEYGTLGAVPHLEGRERRVFRSLGVA